MAAAEQIETLRPPSPQPLLPPPPTPAPPAPPAPPLAPAAGGPWRLLPPLDPETRAALALDISERGVMVAVEVDPDGVIIDGHTRAEIARELGIGYPTVVRHFRDEDAKIHHVLATNLLRRHLDIGARREIVRWLAGERRWSGARIAQVLRCAQMTISRDLGHLVATDPGFVLPAVVEGRTRSGQRRPYTRRKAPARHAPSGRQGEGAVGRRWLPSTREDTDRLRRVMYGELLAWSRHHQLHTMGAPELSAYFGPVLAAINALPVPAGVRRAASA